MKSNPNNIIQSFWFGNSLSTMERLCIESFIQNGHEFHLYTYNNVEHVPKNTILKDANEIIPLKLMFKDNRNGIASFSDWFRYKLLFLKGGIWVDMDMICLKPIDFNDEFCFSSECHEQGEVVNIGFIKAPAQADFLNDLLHIVENSGFKNILWGSFGPKLFNTVLRNFESIEFIKSPEVFCSVNWYEMYKLITHQNILFSEESYCIHFWNEIWRLGCLSKDAIYHPESIYEKLKKKYHIFSEISHGYQVPICKS